MKAPWYIAKFGPPAKPVRRPVRRESKAHARQRLAYLKRRVEWIKGRGCAFGLCPRRATDVHHKRGRLGDLLLDERYWLPLCREHHDWVRDNPDAARRRGLLAEMGEWNKVERIA